MYSLLGMPHKSVDKLVFEDFLKVKDRLVAQEVQLQELNNRAAGLILIISKDLLYDFFHASYGIDAAFLLLSRQPQDRFSLLLIF